MNIKKRIRFSVVFIFTISTLFFGHCLAVQPIGTTVKPAETDERFLTGILIKLTEEEVQTSVGTFQLSRFVKIDDLSDSKKDKQGRISVQLTFKKDQLTKLTIY